MDPLTLLRQINREMLVVVSAEIPPAVADAVEVSRDHLTRAIRLLSPELGKERPPEELPVRSFRAQADNAAGHFRDCLEDAPDADRR